MKDFREEMTHVQCMFRDPLKRKAITVDQFVKFLKVPVSERKVGDTNWTDRYGDNNLQLHGGIIGGIDYLSNIRYGKKLANKYNDFVNPLFMREVLTDEGWLFFCDYYKEEIESICKKYKSEAEHLRDKALHLDESAIFAMKFIGEKVQEIGE